VLIITKPLVPLLPELAVFMTRLPLEVDDPKPVVSRMSPPLKADDNPAEKTMLPEVPLSPDPTLT
jgi:hypothetical protein